MNGVIKFNTKKRLEAYFAAEKAINDWVEKVTAEHLPITYEDRKYDDAQNAAWMKLSEIAPHILFGLLPMIKTTLDLYRVFGQAYIDSETEEFRQAREKWEKELESFNWFFDHNDEDPTSDGKIATEF